MLDFWSNRWPTDESISDGWYLMMPKYSPVRCTTLTLEQPMPENRKVQKNTFKGGSSVEPAEYPPKVKSESVFTTLEC